MAGGGELTSGGSILRPTVNITASLGVPAIQVRALLDSGAPKSVFPRGIGDVLGIEFPASRTDATKKISILGHEWAAISETITLHLPPFDDDLTWDAEVDFVVDEQLSLALLGYEGFLNLAVQRRLGPDELTELVAAYREGVSVEEPAASFGVNRTTVLGHVRLQGVPKRDRRRALLGDDLDLAVKLYSEGRSADCAAGELRVAASTVRRALKYAGVTMRPGGRQR